MQCRDINSKSVNLGKREREKQLWVWIDELGGLPPLAFWCLFEAALGISYKHKQQTNLHFKMFQIQENSGDLPYSCWADKHSSKTYFHQLWWAQLQPPPPIIPVGNNCRSNITRYQYPATKASQNCPKMTMYGLWDGGWVQPGCHGTFLTPDDAMASHGWWIRLFRALPLVFTALLITGIVCHTIFWDIISIKTRHTI